MAEYGEWNRKGATLSEQTAAEEYEVDREFIKKGILSGNLEFRERSIWGNPCFIVLRSQLEQYITEELGRERLSGSRGRTNIRRIKREIASTTKKLRELEQELAELENQVSE